VRSDSGRGGRVLLHLDASQQLRQINQNIHGLPQTRSKWSPLAEADLLTPSLEQQGSKHQQIFPVRQLSHVFASGCNTEFMELTLTEALSCDEQGSSVPHFPESTKICSRGLGEPYRTRLLCLPTKT
jgi:hypothetical protein